MGPSHNLSRSHKEVGASPLPPHQQALQNRPQSRKAPPGSCLVGIGIMTVLLLVRTKRAVMMKLMKTLVMISILT